MIEIVLVALIIIIAVVAYFQHHEVKELQKIITELKKSPDNFTSLPDTQVMHSAQIKAQDIISQAEVESIKLATDKEFELKLFETHFNEKLEQAITSINSSLEQALAKLETNFSHNLDQSYTKHETFISDVEKHTLEWQDKLKDQMNSKVNSLLINFEENLTSFLARAEQESLESINLELKSARQLIDTYKSQQLSLVDENIVAVLERTMNIVIKQKLSLKDQLELVYEALEKAKVEKFLV